MNFPLILAYLFAMFAWIPLQLVRVMYKDKLNTRKLRNASFLSVGLLIYECYMRFIWSPTVVAPIRIDILFLIAAASLISSYYALQFWRLSPPREPYESAFTGLHGLSLTMIVIPLAALAGSVVQSHRSQTMIQQLSDQNRIIYEMGFRDEQTVQRFYGEVTKNPAQTKTYYRSIHADSAWAELLINEKKRFWLFRPDHFRREGQLAIDEKNLLRGEFIGVPTQGEKIEIQLLDDGRIELKQYIQGEKLLSTTKMHQSDLPRFPPQNNAKNEVEFIGNFTVKFNDNGKDFALETIWLWRANGAYWGQHDRARYTRGETSSFNNPRAIEPECIQNCKTLALQFRTNFGTALLTQQDKDHWQLKYLSDPQEPIRVLTRGDYGPDYALDLAPLHTREINQSWISAMTLGYHTKWIAPEEVELRP